jgi:hypothetical protein
MAITYIKAIILLFQKITAEIYGWKKVKTTLFQTIKLGAFIYLCATTITYRKIMCMNLVGDMLSRLWTAIIIILLGIILKVRVLLVGFP